MNIATYLVLWLTSIISQSDDNVPVDSWRDRQEWITPRYH